MIAEMRDLYAYNLWANLRAMDACRPLSSEELHRDLGSSFPTLIGTLAHILAAEWIWLERWSGRSPAGLPDDWDLSTLEAIRWRWNEVETRRAELLASLTDDDLERPLEYRNTRGDPFTAPLGQLSSHVINHSTYHRGQVATMLRQLGHPAPQTDLVLYHRIVAESPQAGRPIASPPTGA